MRLKHPALIPAGAFGLLLAVAAVSAREVGGRPLAQVYARTHAYAAALQAGDEAAVLGFHPPADTPQAHVDLLRELERRADALQGRAYALDLLQPEADGSMRAELIWAPAVAGGGRGRWRLALRWRRDSQGVWRAGP